MPSFIVVVAFTGSVNEVVDLFADVACVIMVVDVLVCFIVAVTPLILFTCVVAFVNKACVDLDTTSDGLETVGAGEGFVSV